VLIYISMHNKYVINVYNHVAPYFGRKDLVQRLE